MFAQQYHKQANKNNFVINIVRPAQQLYFMDWPNKSCRRIQMYIICLNFIMPAQHFDVFIKNELKFQRVFVSLFLEYENHGVYLYSNFNKSNLNMYC